MVMTPVEPGPSTLDPDNFAIRADQLLGTVLPLFVTEANALEATVVEKEASTVAAAAAAVSSGEIAVAAANFVGNWSDQAGALAKPASVRHLGSYWMLLQDLADVTTQTPGSAPSYWGLILSTDAPQNHQINYSIGVI